MKSFFSNRILFIILALAFILPLSYSLFYKIEPVVDARSYNQIAVNILEGYGFREERNLSYEFDPAIIRAGPLYEYFLAGIYFIFGYHYESIWIIQALLHALTALFIFLISKKVFKEGGEQIGILAAAIFGFHPDLIEISSMLLTETLYLFLAVLTVWIFLGIIKNPPTAASAVFLGTILSLAILIRPPVLLFVPIIAAFYFLNRRFGHLAILVSILVICLSPWTIRNYLIYRQFIPTTLVGEYNLWVGNTLNSDGGQLSSGFNPVTSHLETEGAFTLKKEANHQFKNFILEYPGEFLKLTFTRVIRYFSLIRPMGFWFYQDGLPQLVFAAFSGLAIAILFFFGFSGTILMWREGVVAKYLALFTATAPLPLFLSVVQSRYRFQIYPFLAIGAGYMLWNLFKKDISGRKYFLVVAIFLFLASLIDLWQFWPTVAQRVMGYF